MMEFLFLLMALGIFGGIGVQLFLGYPEWKRTRRLEKIEKKEKRKWDVRSEVLSAMNDYSPIDKEKRRPRCNHGRSYDSRSDFERYLDIFNAVAPTILPFITGYITGSKPSEPSSDKPGANVAPEDLKPEAITASPYAGVTDLDKIRNEYIDSIRKNSIAYEEIITWNPGDPHVELGRFGLIIDCEIDVSGDDLTDVGFHVTNGSQMIGMIDHAGHQEPKRDKIFHEMAQRQLREGLYSVEVQGLDPFILSPGVALRIDVMDRRKEKSKSPITFKLRGRTPRN